MNDLILLPTDGLDQTLISAVLWNNLAQVYNRLDDVFETWNDSNIAKYELQSNEQGTTGIYLLTMPTLPSSLNSYSGVYFEKVNGPDIALDDIRNHIAGTFGKANGVIQAPAISSIGVTDVTINNL